ncbi:cell wall metabolism sensor histidine kinase WalK [Tissierella creatinini]|nr:cell wall metabolism sensor histidine kinase WalK [Tissierella creatinini]TJX66667.1 cell wall metabolism sensor histidine kinase WalK [Soehngenia saccharolytica]
MGESLAKQDGIRKRYASDISHELRTPLTTLKTHLEAISDGIWEPNTEHLDILIDEVSRLTKLVEDLKSSFTQEEYNPKINKQRFNISMELENIITSFQPLFRMENYSLQGNIEKNIEVNVDKEKFNQIIYNLLSNSLKYLDENGRVIVSLNKFNNNLVIKIEDNGIGIKEEDLKNIFNRFYRVDTSRNKSTGGIGLGLSIVKSLVEAHSGYIDVKSQYGKGTEFLITLPIE